MAKRRRKGGRAQGTSTEARLGGFAEDLGRLLGTARAKADAWIGQRGQIAKTLEEIRDAATGLLTQLGSSTAGTRRRGPGRPPKDTRSGRPPGTGRKRRGKLLAKTRKAMSEARRKWWARKKAADKNKK